MGDFEDIEEEIILSGNYGWKDIKLSTRFTELKICDLKSHSEDVKGKLTPNMLAEYEDCYRDIMAVCYPEIIRSDIFFTKKQMKDKYTLIVASSICALKVKYNIAFMFFENYYEKRVSFKIVDSQTGDSIRLEATPINRYALVEVLKRLIRFVEHDKRIEIGDDFIDTNINDIYDLRYEEVVFAEKTSDVRSKMVYLSYDSADSKRVMKIADKIRENGYDVVRNFGMDDVGTAPNSRTFDTLAINMSSVYIIFVSNQYINNYKYKTEINYVLGYKRKKCIPVYLDSVELPSDLKMYIGTNKNAVYKYKYDNEQDFYNELFSKGRFE